MKGSIAIGALVAGALAMAVPVTAAAYDTIRMSGSSAMFRSAPAEQEVAQVPVPGTVALLALGGVGLAVVRRVKSRRRGN